MAGSKKLETLDDEAGPDVHVQASVFVVKKLHMMGQAGDPKAFYLVFENGAPTSHRMPLLGNYTFEDTMESVGYRGSQAFSIGVGGTRRSFIQNSFSNLNLGEFSIKTYLQISADVSEAEYSNYRRIGARQIEQGVESGAGPLAYDKPGAFTKLPGFKPR